MIDFNIENPFYQKLLILALLLATAVVSALVGKLITSIMKRSSIMFKKEEWLQFLSLVSKPVISLFVLIGLLIAIESLKIREELDLSLTISIIINVIVTWMAINMIKSLKYFLLQKSDVSTKDNLKARKLHTQLIVFERILIIIVFLIAVSAALMNFEAIRTIGFSLLASAGVAGIIIGFAAQKSIALFLAGIQIAITQPIRLDDVVIVENEWGWIEEITLTYVVVRIWDKRRLIVPINYFIEKPFQNWTRTTAEILGTVFIYVDYKFPVDKLRGKLTELLKETPLWDGNVNVLQVTGLNERTMELRALVSASDSPTAWDLRVWLREKLIEFIRDEHAIFLPQTRIQMPEEKVLSK